MEQAGVVKRRTAGPGDNRACWSITRRGRALAGRFSGAIAAELPDSKALVKAIATAVEV